MFNNQYVTKYYIFVFAKFLDHCDLKDQYLQSYAIETRIAFSTQAKAQEACKKGVYFIHFVIIIVFKIINIFCVLQILSPHPYLFIL